MHVQEPVDRILHIRGAIELRRKEIGMATRTNAQEEKIETLRSVMNVIAIVDLGTPRRPPSQRSFELRSLLPAIGEADADGWDVFLDTARRTNPKRTLDTR